MRSGPLIVCIGVLALAVACSGDDTAGTAATTTGATTTIPEDATTTAVPDDLAIPELAEGEVPVGPYYDAIYQLDLGDCFALEPVPSVDGIVDYVVRMPCTQAHEHELFFETSYTGGDRYPGEDEMRAWALQACYDAFEGFVGSTYEVSTYELGFDFPTQEYFEDPARSYRGVRCWITAPGDEPLTEPAGGTAR